MERQTDRQTDIPSKPNILGKLLEGQLGRGQFARFEAPIEQGSKASQKALKRTTSSGKAPFAFNSMAVKDGRILEGQLGCGMSWPICSLWNANRTRFKGQPKGSKTYCQLGESTGFAAAPRFGRHQVAFWTVKKACQDASSGKSTLGHPLTKGS